LVGALVGRVERGGAERSEDVVRAAGEFAGDRQAYPGVGEPAGLERVVVVVVGAAGMAGRLGGLEQRPAQRRGALSGELAQLRVPVGAVHADIDARFILRGCPTALWVRWWSRIRSIRCVASGS
jgi:hypothetical protein